MSGLPRLLIVDDEPLARERLAALVRDSGAATVVAEAGNGLEALAAVTAHHPDVVLLDIRMPGMDGLEAARHLAALPVPPAVVFTTAFGDHALAAFEADAVAYLLKPIRQEKLVQALVRATTLSQGRLGGLAQMANARSGRTHVSAVIGGNLRLVPVDQVRCFVAEQKYVTVIWPEGELPLEDPLKDLEEEFGERFIRIHRNALVALAWVEGMVQEGDDGWCIAMQGVAKRLPVSRRLVGAVRRALRES